MIVTKKVKALVLSGYGINCENEMAHACRLAGADVVDIVHLSYIIHGDVRITDYNFINLPGGFLDGDNLGAAQMCAHRLNKIRLKDTNNRLIDEFIEVVRRGGVILGVCNGFQLLVKSGLLPGFNSEYGRRLVSLTHNDSARFEDRWVTCITNPDTKCIFTKGISKIQLPVRHGEGKFITLNEDVLNTLRRNNQIVLQYAHPETGEKTMEYPYNPNGSQDAIAGICDETGRIFGLMPHPEAYWTYLNHPHWTRKNHTEPNGLIFFINAVNYLKSN